MTTLKEFEVRITYQGAQTFYIHCEDEECARSKAIEQFFEQVHNGELDIEPSAIYVTIEGEY